MGIDFGYHWDENQQFILVRNSLETGIFLPGWYKYPSVTYWLSLSGTLPHAVLAWPLVNGDWQATFAHLIQVTKTPSFLLQVRTLFLLITMLSIIWVYLQPLVRGDSRLEGLLAAALLGFSWEIAYHARWIAPDTILMQFGALTLLFAALSIQQPQNKSWLYLAAAAAGLACSTKYPGGLLIVPVMIVAYSNNRKIISFIPVFIIFTITYLAFTPGTLLEPIRFIKSVGYELRHYSSGFSEQVISPGVPHLGRMLNYLLQVLFSHFRPIAWIFSLLSFVGAYAFFKTSRTHFLLLTIFPTLCLLYFSTQTVMRARNLLVLAPYLALLSAHGAQHIWERLKQPKLRSVWFTFVTAIVVINAIWLVYAAWSIQARDNERFTAAMVEYVRKKPNNDFWASEEIWRQVGKLETELPDNLRHFPVSGGGYLVFYASEGMENPNDWPGNRPGLATRIFGTWEVNFDYYPRWAGEDRILIMPIEKARQIGIQLVP